MKKVLIVDDDPLAHENLKFHLGQLGFEVIREFDGLVALEKIKIEKPFAVITDTYLMGMMGPKLREQVLSLYPDTIVMACSSKKKSKDLYPADTIFINKPYTLSDIPPEVLKILTA